MALGHVPPDQHPAFWRELFQFMQMLTYICTFIKYPFEIDPHDECDDLDISKLFPRIAPGSPDLLRKYLGLAKADFRDALKTDALRFAHETYRTQGYLAKLDFSGLHNGHALRVSAEEPEVLSCIRDLHHEGWVEMLNREGGFRLNPARSSEVANEITARDQAVDARLRQLAQEDGWLSEDTSAMKQTIREDEKPKNVSRVFIVHGHDEAKRRELAELLKDRFGLEVAIMMEKPGKSRTFIEKFEDEASPCDAAIAILTPDDVVEGEDEYKQPRPNVFFELGWFAGKLGRNRVLLVVKEGTNTPTDLLGIEQIRFSDAISERILELERELAEWKGKT